MKKFKNLIITISVILFWTILNFFGIFQKFEYRFYDVILGNAKAPPEAPELLLVEADNLSLENVGPWPWKRDVYANILMRMKEFGAKTAVFDIEFLSPSNFPESDDIFAQSIQFFGNTFLTINTSYLDINYSQNELDYVRDRFLLDPKGQIDLLVFGNNISRYESQKNSHFGFSKINWNDSNVKNDFSIGLSPAKYQFISHSKGAGFTNIIIDNDGSRRRVELLNYQPEYKKAVGQLTFYPLIQEINPKEIIRNKNSIILKDANVNGKIQNIKIPLDKYGRMIVNWSHKKYQDSFRHESISFLDMLDKSENNLVSILSELSSNNNLLLENLTDDELYSIENSESAINSIISINSFLQNYSDIADYKNYLLSICNGFDANSEPINGGITGEDYDNYFALRNEFFNALLNFSKSSQNDIAQEFLFNARDFIGEKNYETLASNYNELFELLAHEINLYTDTFNEKAAIYKDSFCIIGNTASSTTDLGTTPFERAYPNVGTHANVYNTIINRTFITPINDFFGIILIAILLILQEIFLEKKRVFVKNIFGISTILFSLICPIILMRFFSIYTPAFVPILISFTSYLTITILRFLNSEKDKKFLQTTFGAYVAPAVVSQIVKNPELAKLGGKSEDLTALFSDVRSFSSFTEIINNEYGEEKGAEKLVEILNLYLGELSDAIMNNNGTIDKYVGDEIVSFFGAPVPTKNNAFDACVAAIRMIQTEAEFNKKNLERLPIDPKTNEPFLLRSRVGLNTGTMVVGNMGTEKKLNYTIMGNNVNLASRLEGINKVYGSWITCSESTWTKANEGEYKGKLVARKFDYVRVVNVKKPVGIYNILGLKDELPAEQIEAAEYFNKGMELYLRGSETPEVKKNILELKEALKYFKKAYSVYPEDKSSVAFIKRCTDYITDGVPESWDGVYTMTSK